MELKFRAWDVVNRVMMYEYQWFDSKTPCMGGGGHRKFTFSNNGRNSIGGECCSAHHHVMQFTGCNDTNGTEIYEGDIIANTHVGQKTVVVFSNGSFGSVESRDLPWRDDKFLNQDVSFVALFDHDLEYFEVVGNRDEA